MATSIETDKAHRQKAGGEMSGERRTPPTYSVVICCYNSAAWLRNALESLLNQTITDWEAIVVDDGSTVPGLEQVKQELTDARIRWLYHDKNRGLAAARNTGFRAARADLILPLDADDQLTPTFLEVVGGVLRDDPSVDCAFSDFQCFGHCQDVWRFPVRDAKAMTKEQWIPGPGTVMRKELWQRIGGYCIARPLVAGNEDWDFCLSAIEQGVRAVNVPEPLYLYQRHEESMSTRQMRVDWPTREFIYRRHRNLFDRFDTGKAFRAKGYRNSAGAASKQGQYLRAACLSLMAWWLSPWMKQEPEARKKQSPRPAVSIPSGASV